jgi:hypothetical protein
MVKIQSIGVIGAGQMGSGIAHVCALAGYSVLLNDLSADRIKAGMATINGNMARQVGKKAISEDDRKNALARIKPAEKYDAFSGCDLVIETATEKEEVKRKIFGELLGAEDERSPRKSRPFTTRLFCPLTAPSISSIRKNPSRMSHELIRGRPICMSRRADLVKLGKIIADWEDRRRS